MLKTYHTLLAGLCLLLVSCNNPSQTENQTETLVPVRVHVSDFSFSSESFPDASTRTVENPVSYSAVKAIDVAIFTGDTPVYQTTQYRDDASAYKYFGEFECSLPVGNYTMVTIARNMSSGDEFTITSPTQAAYTSERARETFCNVQPVQVAFSSGVDISPTLKRVMAQFRLTSTDALPSGIARMRTTYSAGSKSFNPTTGLATDNHGFSVTNTAKALSAGHIDMFSILFLPSDEATLDVTIQALDANDQVLLTKTLPHVQFKCNRVTHATGRVFSVGPSTFTLSLNTDWLPEMNIAF